jgi:hypothetical protein
VRALGLVGGPGAAGVVGGGGDPGQGGLAAADGAVGQHLFLEVGEHLVHGLFLGDEEAVHLGFELVEQRPDLGG